MKTPITYYGGKQQMLKYILPMMPEHHVYVEPFFGGGAVFFGKEPAKIELINDTNAEIVNFYKVLKSRFAELKPLVDMTLYSEYQYKQARQIYTHPDEYDDVHRAWAVWVLSHQSFYSNFTSTWRCSKEDNTAAWLQSRKEAFTEDYCRRLSCRQNCYRQCKRRNTRISNLRCGYFFSSFYVLFTKQTAKDSVCVFCTFRFQILNLLFCYL